MGALSHLPTIHIATHDSFGKPGALGLLVNFTHLALDPLTQHASYSRRSERPNAPACRAGQPVSRNAKHDVRAALWR